MTEPARTNLSAIPLGTYRGVPVRAHWSLLLTALVVAEILADGVLPASVPDRTTAAYWTAGLIGAVLFLASVLAHELMHAVAARHYGMRVERITLWLLGGMAEIKGDPPTPRAAAVIAGIGPATSLGVAAALGLVGWAATLVGLPALGTATLLWLALTNGILAVFNLLPGAPLDGGRLLHAALWHRYRDPYRATVTATRVGRGLGVALVGIGVLQAMTIDVVGGLWMALIGWFLVAAARAEATGAAMRARLPDVTLGQLMRPLPAPLPGWWTVAQVQQTRRLTELLHDVLPVVDLDGHPLGVVTWRDIATRHTDDDVPIRTLCRQLPVLAADRNALDAVQEGAFGRGAALVQDGAGGFGIVTAADLEHAAQITARH